MLEKEKANFSETKLWVVVIIIFLIKHSFSSFPIQIMGLHLTSVQTKNDSMVMDWMQLTCLYPLIFFCSSQTPLTRIRSCFLQPAFGTPIQGKDVIICNFPDDPTVLLGTSSVVTLILAAVAGHVAIYFPYKGKSVPSNALFQNTILLPFFIVAE